MMKRSFSELLRTKRDTELAERGADVLEKMENALTKEQLSLQRRVKDVESECLELMGRIEASLAAATDSAVMSDVEKLIETEELDNRFSIGHKKKFGKLISVMEPVPPAVLTSRWGAPIAYEDARALSKKLLAKLIDLGNAQNELAFIESELAKTRRRVNALRKVIIPDLEGRKKSLEEWMDEETREELGRRRWVEDVVFG